MFLPQLAVTGASCGELFFHPGLQKAAMSAVEKIAASLPEDRVAVIGAPYSTGGMDEIWDMDSESDERTVDVHINRLRDRFKGNSDFEILTVRGLGYKAIKKQ
jgi:hypothetical protein